MIDRKKADREPDRKLGQKPAERVSFWQVVSSTLYAAIGVQKRANRERDFARGKPLHFIIAGLVFTTLFVLIMILVVRLVLSNAAS